MTEVTNTSHSKNFSGSSISSISSTNSADEEFTKLATEVESHRVAEFMKKRKQPRKKFSSASLREDFGTIDDDDDDDYVNGLKTHENEDYEIDSEEEARVERELAAWVRHPILIWLNIILVTESLFMLFCL